MSWHGFVLKMNDLKKQIIRFVLVGGTAFVIDYICLYIFTEYFHIHYLISAVLAFTISTIFNYIASILWVFNVDANKSKIQTLITFLIFSVMGLLLNEFIMWFGVEKLAWYYMLVKLFATAIVMVFNFITRKMFLE